MNIIILYMMNSLKGLGRYYCTNYFQKNHKNDFTANRVSEKFLHLHLDFMEMDISNFDERMLINIYIKAIKDNNVDLFERTVKYLKQNVDHIQNLMTITNILEKRQSMLNYQDHISFYQVGFKIMAKNQEDEQGCLLTSFKNFDVGCINRFFAATAMSRFKYLLNDPQYSVAMKKSLSHLNPYYNIEMIRISHENDLPMYVQFLCQRLQKMSDILILENVKKSNEINQKIQSPILKRIVSGYKGTKHREQYNYYN